MSTPILATKLYVPPPRPGAVLRPRLIERLDAGLAAGHKLTLVSAPAGFGKTTLISEWVAREGGATPPLPAGGGTPPLPAGGGTPPLPAGGATPPLPAGGATPPLPAGGGTPPLPAGGATPPLPVAWLSLDAGDNDLARFLTYLIAALQTVGAEIGAGVLPALQAPQPPPIEPLLTTLLNELVAVRQEFILVLDDYHLVEAQAVDQVLAFLLEHLPPQMHVVIATREDPNLPLARLRARGQLTELRAADLRFTPAEAAEFLNRAMGLDLSAQEIAALETRTEGWIAGLQLAALSMQGHPDAASFIESFTGSHHFVLDYLVEEVLAKQPASVQTFLLRTSILERLCGPLCDAVMDDRRQTTDEGQMAGDASVSSSVLRPSSLVLEYLEHANLFVIPLDNERRWYRYHHLFAELLRQRLSQKLQPAAIAAHHVRASAWYEDNGLQSEAFHHAAAANDVPRAERLIEQGRMPLHALAVLTPVLDWLNSLPKTVLDARPWLWVRAATSTLMAGQTTGVEEKLQAAEAALAAAWQNADGDEKTRDLIGQIAAIRATLAVVGYQPEAAISQARRALAHLHPSNQRFRSRATWTLGFAHQLLGDRAAARQVYAEAIKQAAGDTYYTVLASTNLGQIQEADNQLHEAAATYRRSLQLLSDHGPPNASEEFIGLARIHYEWNDLDAAEQHAQQSLQLARQYDPTIDRFIACEVFLARVQLARGDAAGAAAMLAQSEGTARQHDFVRRIPEVAAAQVMTLLRQGDVTAAAHLAQRHELPLSQARVRLAQGDPAAALGLLAPVRQQAETRHWPDERLKALALQAVALHAHGDREKAAHALAEALALAEPGGFIRLFVDEGPPMAQLLSEAAARAIRPDYVAKLLAGFGGLTEDEGRTTEPSPSSSVLRPFVSLRAGSSSLVEPLSQRESEILRLIAQGLSNRAIGERLFLALDTVKGHNRRIFDKLQVESRTEAIARAHELGLL